jgi:WD40 repeat protein
MWGLIVGEPTRELAGSTGIERLWDNPTTRSMSMPQHPAIHRLRIISGVMIFAFTLIFAAQALTRESVRAELIRLQAEKGLTLAWVDNSILTESIVTHTPVHGGVQAILFKTRTIVPLKDSLQVFRPDAFSFREYPKVSGIGACWSPDQTKLVDTMIDRSTGRATLEILDLISKRTHAIAINVDQREYVTSQCWSPDGKRLVYGMDDAVRLYELDNDRMDAVAKGTDPTWSPDGNWIAFRDRETYYAMHPNGSGRKKLFHNHWGGAVSGLYWSPDSRIVAYVRELGFLQGGGLDAEVNQLRVRRLEDGAEDRLCPDSVDWYANYHWITTSELMNHPRPESPH